MSLTLLAPAKINLTLKILSKRKDGYHNLLSLMQTISLYDRIKISKIKKNDIKIICNIKSISNRKNLCYKIAKLLKEKYNIPFGIKIEIKKNIPIGSGLGGASSDAAATAEGIIKLFNLKITKIELLNICSKIGADIPFFLYKGLCLAEGIGEKIKKIKIKKWKEKPIWYILIYPSKILSTKKVYQTFDKLKNKKLSKINKAKILSILKQYNGFSNKLLKKLLINDLEIAAFKICPQLAELKHRIYLKNELVSMSGSGSCMFIPFANKFKAISFKKAIEKELRKFYLFRNYKIFVVKSVF